MSVFCLDPEGRIVLGGHVLKLEAPLTIQMAPGLVVEVDDEYVVGKKLPILDPVTGKDVIEVTLTHEAEIRAKFKASVARLTLGHLSSQHQKPPGGVFWPI